MYHTGVVLGNLNDVKWAENWRSVCVDEQASSTVRLRAPWHSVSRLFLCVSPGGIYSSVNETPNMFVFQICYLESTLGTHLVSIPKLKEQIVNLEAEVSAQDKILR